MSEPIPAGAVTPIVTSVRYYCAACNGDYVLLQAWVEPNNHCRIVRKPPLNNYVSSANDGWCNDCNAYVQIKEQS